MVKTLKLQKSLRDVIDDVSGYSVVITQEDTNEESSMLLLNVELTKDTEAVLIQRRTKRETMETQLALFETEKIDIEVILPAILEKTDFSKVNLEEYK